MGISTGIAFADSTRNLVMGCDGCELWRKDMKPEEMTCYAELLTRRYAGKTGWPEEFGKPKVFPHRININWPSLEGTDRPNKPWLNGYKRVIFECDMSDAWTESLDVMWLEPFMEKMINDGHIHLFITKRPKRAVEFFNNFGWVPSNFWILTTITSSGNVSRARELAKLYKYGATVLGVSAEPLRTEIDLKDIPLDWVIVGGESGANHIEMPVNAPYKILDDCKERKISFFMKQLGGHPNKRDKMEDFPPILRIREMP